MITKKTFISIFTLCIALLFTACGTQDSAGTANTKDSELNPVQRLLIIPMPD